MNKFLIGAAALGVALPALAQVAPAADRMQTRDQVVAKVRDHFAKLDTNRDGAIASDELQAMRGQHLAMRRKHDGDGDRMAMREGPMGNPNAAFDRLDANRDGMISRDEFAQGRAMHGERKMAMNEAPRANGREHRAKGGHLVKMADADKDGRITLPEMTAAALQHFDRIDTNRDGRITPDERKAMHQQMMEAHSRNAG